MIRGIGVKLKLVCKLVFRSGLVTVFIVTITRKYKQRCCLFLGIWLEVSYRLSGAERMKN